MHKQLSRQLRKCFELADETALDDFLGQLQQQDCPQPAIRQLLDGFSSFLNRIDQSYSDAERDLKLRERSLSLSSSELTEAYDNIRQDIEEQNKAVNQLRNIANQQLTQLNKPLLSDGVNTLEALAQVFVRLSEEHRQAELALQQQKDALDLHAIVSIFDPDGIITYVNQKFCDLNEYSYDELIGHTHERINPQLKQLPFYPELRRTLEAGKPWHGELEQFSKSGRRHILYATLVPIVDEHGKPVRFIAIHTDITRQKELEASLSQSSRFYRSITDAIGESVYVLDAGGHVTFMNPEAERALGLTQSELENQLLYATAVPCNADGSSFEQLLHHVNQGIPYKSEAHSFEHVSGHVFPVALTAVPLRDEKHNIVGHVGVFSDISERKQTEKELHQALDKAELANRTKSEFLANMSHEIRTPMNAILGLTHLALNTSLTPQQQGYIEKANKGASSLLRIINDILDFSKVEAGKLELEEKPFPLKNALQQVAQIFQSKAQQKGLEFLIDAPFSSEQFVNGDETRIVQILTNLVGNAIKFTEQGFVKVSVHVSPGKDKQWFTFIVEDSGIGMSDAQTASIFKAFNQADASISRRFGGTGLGMTITRRLVEQMNGSITVESQPDKGSKFTARLLLSAPSFPFSLAQTSLVEDALIWTDNSLPHTVSVLDKMLRHLGHGSQISRTLDSAFDIKANVLFLVCSMPSQSVTAVLKQVEVSNKHIVLVSNRSGEEVTHALNLAGLYFIKVLCQPFLTEDISALLASGIEQPVPTRNEPASLDDAASISLRMKGKQILVVEDDPVSQEIISHQLSEILAEVTTADCGKDALALLETQTFDLIIMDSKLPDISGWEVSEILTYERQLSIPIIGISADGFSETTERAIEAGMCEHLSKPVIKEDLLRHIDRHIHYSGSDIDILLQHVCAQDDTHARSLQHFYKVRVAPSGQIALKIIERTPPDLILLDVMMPEMDGLEVCKRLKSQPAFAGIPVIFVTALGQGEDEERGFAVGAVDYIAKPIVPALVLARVKTHLALSHQQKVTEQAVQQRTQALLESQHSAINMLATAGHYNDTDTGVHIWRMAAYAKALALRLHWPVAKAELLGQAATMHDTGKIGIPDSILKAPRRLTDEEMEIMREHAQIGYEILSQSHCPLFDLAAEVAWCHHEKWDGSGYPRKLQGTDIPESARIVALADVFDALTMERPYKKAWSCDAAFDYIRSEAGSHFDPKMVELFCSMRSELIDIKQEWAQRERQTTATSAKAS